MQVVVRAKEPCIGFAQRSGPRIRSCEKRATNGVITIAGIADGDGGSRDGRSRLERDEKDRADCGARQAKVAESEWGKDVQHTEGERGQSHQPQSRRGAGASYRRQERPERLSLSALRAWDEKTAGAEREC